MDPGSSQSWWWWETNIWNWQEIAIIAGGDGTDLLPCTYMYLYTCMRADKDNKLRVEIPFSFCCWIEFERVINEWLKFTVNYLYSGEIAIHLIRKSKIYLCEDEMFIPTYMYIANSRTKLFSFSHTNTQHTAHITDNLIKFMNFILLLIHFFWTSDFSRCNYMNAGNFTNNYNKPQHTDI